MEQIDELLRSYFGYSDFRPGQRTVIEHLMAGRSAAAVFPTGGGKSICYQLPSLALPGLTLVVSPLLALMKDQIDQLTKRGIPAARLDSTLDAQQVSDVMSAVRSNSLRMLYVAPERFANERFRQAIQGVRVSLFAVDEAHCLSEWGHNFRPDYLKLARYAQSFQAERVLALTATATPQVLRDICSVFQISDECAVRTSSYRSNLTLLTTPASSDERDAALLQRLSDRSVGPAIVYVTQQQTAESIASRITAAGLDARPYHAGMKDDERSKIQEWFLASERAIVVATIAFGMGIDKSNIRYVYHYNLPKSLENYSQEIGRAGRDGQPAICESFVCLDDLNTLENFVYGDTPDYEALDGMTRELFADDKDLDVSLYDLSYRFDIRQIVLRTLLTYLELDGFIEELTPYYSEYSFKPLVTSQEILSRFDAERQAFLRGVLKSAKQALTWFQLDIERAAIATKSNRDRVVRAIDYLAEQQLIELKVAGLRHRYRKLKSPPDMKALVDRLHTNAVIREEREIGRLGQFLELTTNGGCQVKHLASHFGESLKESCGHCSWCLRKGETIRLPNRQPFAVTESVWKDAFSLRAKKRGPLATTRGLTRFLCGITSPRSTRAKLSAEPLFGKCANIPFRDVMKRIESGA